jgi:hypothetical protein
VKAAPSRLHVKVADSFALNENLALSGSGNSADRVVCGGSRSGAVADAEADPEAGAEGDPEVDAEADGDLDAEADEDPDAAIVGPGCLVPGVTGAELELAVGRAGAGSPEGGFVGSASPDWVGRSEARDSVRASAPRDVVPPADSCRSCDDVSVIEVTAA